MYKIFSSVRNRNPIRGKKQLTYRYILIQDSILIPFHLKFLRVCTNKCTADIVCKYLQQQICITYYSNEFNNFVSLQIFRNMPSYESPISKHSWTSEKNNLISVVYSSSNSWYYFYTGGMYRQRKLSFL